LILFLYFSLIASVIHCLCTAFVVDVYHECRLVLGLLCITWSSCSSAWDRSVSFQSISTNAWWPCSSKQSLFLYYSEHSPFYFAFFLSKL